MTLTRITFLFFFILVPTVFAQTELEKYFKNTPSTIVIHDQKADSTTAFNVQRASIRYSPFSTYKIPNSIIALETGTVQDIENVIKWDRKKYLAQDWWPKTWLGENNLKSALKYSVVPAYRFIASQIGNEKMQSYVDEFDYGNKDISSGLDNFWLNGSLKISALEQIEFLRKFYNGQLKISPKTIKLVKQILIQEQAENYTLSAKTGGGYLDEGPKIAFGWYVGYVEKGDNVYFFALNIEGISFNETQKLKIEVAKKVLTKLGIIQ